MRKHRLGIEEASRAIVVSRAMRRELLARDRDGADKNKKATATAVTPVEAIHRLISKMSLDNILYESGDDSDYGQEELHPLAIPKINRGTVPSSSSINVSSTITTTPSNNNTTNHTSTRKNNARSKKITTASPRKQVKTNHGRASRSKNGPVNNNNNNNISNNNNNNILVGRKRSIEDIDDSTTANAEVDAKIVANPADGNSNSNGNGSRPPLRASKRLHRSSTATEPVVDES